MSPEELEASLDGGRETDAIEFKGPVGWDRNLFVKDILALANTIDGGSIIVGVEDKSFARKGVTEAQALTYDYDIMRDQIAPFADPRVIFSRQVLADQQGLRYVVIEVAPFEELPVICARDGADVQAGTIYYRSRARSPASARVSRSEDMREIIEASVARRLRKLRRAGFVAEQEPQYDYDAELGDL